ncbi:MAG: flavin reductase family protein [Clostridiales bacterium]|jgi:flavin reductase (DIM6/NTAB) family NADH-FMN oxidoreductase RutF|nr:flavin reductase family protein [Clostridiales bacterium]
MSHINFKPGTLLSPTAVVMVSCAGENTKPNIITLAWVGTVNSDPPMVSISIRPQRYSYDVIRESGEFVVNLVSREMMKACDFCGVRSGRDVDKFLETGLDAVSAQGMSAAPAILQSPAYLACKVKNMADLGSHTMYLGEIVGMGIREDLVDKKGKIDFVKADLVAYCHGEYVGLTKPEGFFGFSIARPEVLMRRLKRKQHT